MSRSQAMLDTLDESMRQLGQQSLDSDEAASMAYGLLVRAISLVLGSVSTPDTVQRVASENVEALLELREGLRQDRQEAAQ